jgi:CDP-diacylglycerol--glycerol-3-phosphate 3-phosphatidyltransferase
MANIITCFRILVSFALLFFPVHSVPFNLLYLTAGISDMVDGMVARRTNNATEFGARLDTAADFVFVIIWGREKSHSKKEMIQKEPQTIESNGLEALFAV